MNGGNKYFLENIGANTVGAVIHVSSILHVTDAHINASWKHPTVFYRVLLNTSFSL
jgi:hypothetical protein